MRPVARWHHTLNERFFDAGAYIRLYRSLVSDALNRPELILNLGSGDGTTLNHGRLVASHPKARYVCVDLAYSSLARNPAQLKVVADAAAMPFRDDTFDTVCSEHVLEHLPDPATVMREVQRSLRPKGKFIFATPNGWSYIALLARLIPLRFHEFLIRLGTHAPGEAIHFQTHYRANSARTIRHLAGTSGLSVESLRGFVGEPCYTLSLPVVHLLMIAYHKTLEALRLDLSLGMTIVGTLAKKD